MTVNEEEFNAEMQKQKERARNAAAVETGDWITIKEGDTHFVGYDFTEYETSILRYRQIKQKNQTLYQIVLSDTPFYAESGGQVGDTGVIVSEFETIEIIDTKKENNLPIHITKKLPEHLDVPMMACVDTEKRAACAANHSCTHLLDEALRQVLGTHVEQKGSLVTPESLRFDFSHFQKVTDEQLREVEHLVNAKIRENIPLTEYRNLPIEKAKELVLLLCSVKNTVMRYVLSNSETLLNSVEVPTFRLQARSVWSVLSAKALLLPVCAVSKLSRVPK